LSGQLDIRLASPSDEVEIRQCARNAYRPYVAEIGKEPAPMIADFQQLIATGTVYVSPTATGKVAGFIVFYPREDHMFLENVAVQPSETHRGIGRAMIGYCEAAALRLGLASVQLYTNEKMTGNLTLYLHLGYQEVERRPEDGFNRVYFEKVLAPN